MATPRKPVRHGRVRPSPDTSAQPPASTTPATSAQPPASTTTPPTGTIPLVIRVVYEPFGSLAEVEVRLTYEDPANGYSQSFTLSLRAADGPQERAIPIQAPDPTHVLIRWSVRGFTSDGVVVESAPITTGDPQVKIDGPLQAALLRQ